MKRIKNIVLLLILFLMISSMMYANDYYAEVRLSGHWKFSIGDDLKWAEPNYNDSDWDRVYVPARWEEEGYQGYNGYAWYRKKVEIPQSFNDRIIYLELGYIDDVDEVYFNGEKVGQSGTFPPHFSTAYNSRRKYQIPSNLIIIGGDNTIAVRTFDAQLEGGIVRGDIRIVAAEIAIIPDIEMNGYWDFNLGSDFNSKKRKIMVPGSWENQGYSNYDGYAVYSTTVNIPDNLANKKMIFLAGRIDDDDQLFINGELVGSTGDIKADNNTDKHREFRNYFIPDGVIKAGENTIYIRVIDRGGEGGILEGSIGFITQDNFIKYWRKKRL